MFVNLNQSLSLLQDDKHFKCVLDGVKENREAIKGTAAKVEKSLEQQQQLQQQQQQNNSAANCDEAPPQPAKRAGKWHEQIGVLFWCISR